MKNKIIYEITSEIYDKHNLISKNKADFVSFLELYLEMFPESLYIFEKILMMSRQEDMLLSSGGFIEYMRNNYKDNTNLVQKAWVTKKLLC